MTHSIKWQVGLSDGKNYIEGGELFEIVSGELSPWLKLQEYIKNNDLVITSMSLVSGKKTFNLPSKGNRPKFRAFANLDKPVSYNFFRMVGGDTTGDRDLFAVAEAHYSSYKLQLWVDEHNSNNCWTLVRSV